MQGKKAKGGKGPKKVEEPPSPYPPRIAVELATLRPFDPATLAVYEPTFSVTSSSTAGLSSSFGMRSPSRGGAASAAAAAAPIDSTNPMFASRGAATTSFLPAIRPSTATSALLLGEEDAAEGKQAEMAATAPFSVLLSKPNLGALPKGLQVIMVPAGRYIFCF
jgi:hypothetical protein